MVAGALAGVVRAAGSGMMRSGTISGGFAQGAKKAGMSSGSIKNVELGGKSLKYLGESALSLGVMSKAMKSLSKASPALKQQMIIFGKGISLLLRPIGDILAKFVRPGMVWLMKFAMKWYQMLGGGGADANSAAAIEDKIKNLDVEIASAAAEGDTDKVDRLMKEREGLTTQKASAEKEESYGLFGDWKWKEKFNEKILIPIDDWLTDFVTGAFSGWDWKEKWNEYILDPINKFFSGDEEGSLSSWKQYWNDNVLGSLDKFFEESLEGVGSWATDIYDNYIAPAWEDTKDWAADIWKTYIVEGWKGIKLWSATIWDLYIVKGFKDAVDWGDKIWTLMKTGVDKLISKIKSWRPSWLGGGDDDEKSGAVGLKIRESGSYNLHAGEEVIRAGEVGNSQGSSPNITNHFNINATINNDVDIQTLANRLAELQEVQLRRRTSYI